MKILSKFKDYYDFVGAQYGGGDPKIIYERKPLAKLNESGTTPNLKITISGNVPDNYLTHTRGRSFTSFDFDVRLLIICDGQYGLIKHKNAAEYVIFTEEHLKLFGKYSSSKLEPLLSNNQNPYWTRVCREVSAPVFVIDSISFDSYRNNKRTLSISPVCPKLSDYGMPSIVSPEQMYQNIAYFLGNTILSPTPDNLPHTTIPQTDSDKLIAHGFDKKQSFRHRK